MPNGQQAQAKSNGKQKECRHCRLAFTPRFEGHVFCCANCASAWTLEAARLGRRLLRQQGASNQAA